MKIPGNTELFETAIGTLWFDESGILCSVSKKNVPLTKEAMSDEFIIIQKMAKGKKVCWLGDVTNASMANKEVRDFAAAETPGFVKALALITNSPFSKMLANIFLRLKQPPYPTKVFTNEGEAKEWLKQYL